MKIDEVVLTGLPVHEVFGFLADFRNTEVWDPGTVQTTRVSGDGGFGTRYQNVSRFMGRTTELTYVVQEYEPPTRIVLRGENKSVVAHDTMTFEATVEGRTVVRYRAVFELKGLARLAAPFLAPAFRKLGHDGVRQLKRTLDQLESVD